MAFEVVVVGGGFGGLTVAALLAARGVNVCLIEKESRPGGCASTVEKFGYSFETGVSMYTSWGAGEIHERVFSELRLDPPEVRPLSPAYVVRLPDGTDFPISANREEFDANLAEAFPECFDIARAFYLELEATGDALRRVLVRVPDLPTASRTRRLAALGPELRNATRLLTNVTHTVEQHLVGASNRFRRFVDVQLQTFGQCESKDCAFLYAAVALTAPLRGMYDIVGGAGALADSLVESIRKAGGTVRFDTNVLRAVLDAEGNATGVDLLSGERIDATRAVISNLTVWDTYG
ncbi:MAG: phytoene desaturase family protein, partial [Pyrinomonadaceae bacterium]